MKKDEHITQLKNHIAEINQLIEHFNKEKNNLEKILVKYQQEIENISSINGVDALKQLFQSSPTKQWRTREIKLQFNFTNC